MSDNDDEDDNEVIDEEELVFIDEPTRPAPILDFKEMAKEVGELLESVKITNPDDVTPEEEQQVNNLVDFFTKAKISADDKLLELDKRKEVKNLLYELEKIEPVEVFVIGLVPVPGQPSHIRRLVTLTTLKTMQEANHLLDSAKFKMF